MKELDDSFIAEDEELKSIRRLGKKKVVIVKEIMGQGAMHDNFIPSCRTSWYPLAQELT